MKRFCSYLLVTVLFSFFFNSLSNLAFSCELSPNERLRVFCSLEKSKSVPLSGREFISLSNDLGRLGFPPLIKGTKVENFNSFSLSPSVNYSSNINGGNPKKPMVIGIYFWY